MKADAYNNAKATLTELSP